MKFKFFSVVVGTEACVSACPFCVSREKICKENSQEPEVNWRNFRIAANLATKSNIDTVELTSRGETLLFPELITKYLCELKAFNFPFIELQTNGILIGLNNAKDEYLKEWYDLGLTTIAISVVGYDRTKNGKNYIKNGREYMDLPKVIERLHSIGFSVRLACICYKGGIDSQKEVNKMIEFAKENKVEQLTLRPVNDEYRKESAKIWVEEHKLKAEDKCSIREFLNSEGTKLLELDRIGEIFDVYGQNVMFSVPLNKYTIDYSPENGRQLIFFQDGHLRYEWEHTGGILL